LHAIAEQQASLRFIANQCADVEALCNGPIHHFLARAPGCTGNQHDAFILAAGLRGRYTGDGHHRDYRHEN
jgi:hypothetical protein